MSFKSVYKKLLEDMENMNSEPQNDITGSISEDDVLNFFFENPNPNDKAFHTWAEENSFNVHKAEEMAYKLVSEYAKFLKGGKWNEKGNPEVDPDELEKGIKIEYEHTSRQEDAERIAKDHLAEIPDYYTRLIKMEDEANKTGNTLDEARDIKDYVGKYLHRGITGSDNYEKAVKIKDAKRGRYKGSVKLLIGNSWVDFNHKLDHISKSE